MFEPLVLEKIIAKKLAITRHRLRQPIPWGPWAKISALWTRFFTEKCKNTGNQRTFPALKLVSKGVQSVFSLTFIYGFLPLVVLSACASRRSNNRLHQFKSPENIVVDYLFTILEPAVAAQKSRLTGFSGSLRKARPDNLGASAGYLSRGTIQGTFRKLGSQEEGLELRGDCSGESVSLEDSCQWTATFWNQDNPIKCEEIANHHPNELSFACEGGWSVRLIQRSAMALPEGKSVLAGDVQSKLQKGLFDFGLGEPFGLQFAWVHPNRPLRFILDPVFGKTQFETAFKNAAKYWNELIGFEAIALAKGQNFSREFSFLESYVGALPGTHSKWDGKGWSLVDPLTGQIISAKMDINPELEKKAGLGQLEFTLVHEMGHILGLTHNFAASQDPFIKGTALPSTSVMDYLHPKNISSKGPLFQEPLPYDEAMVQFLYQNQIPTQEFRHCSDSERFTILGCELFDPPGDLKSWSLQQSQMFHDEVTQFLGQWLDRLNLQLQEEELLMLESSQGAERTMKLISLELSQQMGLTLYLKLHKPSPSEPLVDSMNELKEKWLRELNQANRMVLSLGSKHPAASKALRFLKMAQSVVDTALIPSGTN
jgi:hypothetical protein